MKLALKNMGSAPETARSLTVAVYGQFADRPAREKKRLHDKRIGAHRQPAGRHIEHRGIAQVFQFGIAKGRQKQVFHQFVAQFAAAAVAHHDGGVTG